MARSENDDLLSPYAKQEIFKKAFDTIKFFTDSGNLVGGFVLTFSILEDRIRAALVDCYKSINEPLPVTNISKIPFGKVVDRLKAIKVIDDDLSKRLKAAANTRNELTHQMMWRLDVFKLEHIQDFKLLINEVKKNHRRFISIIKKDDSKDF